MNYKNMFFVVILCATNVLSTVSAMEGTRYNKDFVDLPMKEISYYYTSNPEFHKEYKADMWAHESGESVVSFPVRYCDPLPVKILGGVQWFTTSATTGNRGAHGRNLEIINTASVTHICAVRAKSDYGRAELYFGYDADKPLYQNADRMVFQGTLLYLFNKDAFFKDELFSAKQFSGVKDVASRLSRQPHAYAKCYFKPQTGMQPMEISPKIYSELYYGSPECYWTETENKLKRITYAHNKK